MTSPTPLLSAFRQALTEAWAGGAGLILPFGFFAGTAMLVPFAVGSDPAILAQIGPGILWLALALASLVTLERLFQADLQDGALDLWVQEGGSISLIALVKTLAHWFVSGLPLVVFTPLFTFAFTGSMTGTGTTMLVYGLGGLTFFLWGGVAGALTASVSRAGLLITLIALPFYVPALIFGVQTLNNGYDSVSFLLLGAGCLFALGVAPAAMGAALRLAAD